MNEETTELTPCAGAPTEGTVKSSSQRSRHARPLVHMVIDDRRGAVNARTLPILAAAAEFGLVATAAFGAGSLYHWAVFGQMPSATFYFGAALALSGLFVVPCGFSRDYSVKRLLEKKEQFRSVLLNWNWAYSLFVFALFMLHATDFYSRGSIVAQYVIGLATALFVRLLATGLVAKGLKIKRVRGRSVVVIGEATRVQNIVSRLRRDGRGAEIAGVIVLSPRPSTTSASATRQEAGDIVAETRLVLETMRDLSQRMAIDEIVLDLPWSDCERIRALMEALTIVPTTLHLAPEPAWTWTRNLVLAHVGKIPTIRLVRAPLTLRDLVLKRAFDIAVASALFIFALPLFAAIAIAIKLESPGPVLFRQRRLGFNQHEFRVLKFRTMTTLDDGPVIRQATRKDHRITKVGRFLRSTNLDELPQLFNVLLGQMSLVGPRPHALAHNNEYETRIQLYAQRHKVKPGITGLAQVNGHRGETDSIDKMLRRVEHDLLYIDNWSLLTDVKILLMTLFSPRSYRNAY
jgi:Undecaprenyl-phosphate glucose phosphotransferase